MTREEIIDGLEIYTVGRLNKDIVHITVEELQKFIDAIKDLEQEPKTGHWINIDDIESECSECGHRESNERFIFEDINFCAKCGAKMFEPQERSNKE